MTVTAIYIGGKPVKRIWLGGRIIWPLDIELSVAHHAELFANGIHNLLAGTTVLLAIDYPSVTHSGSGVLIAPAISCIIRVDSISRSETDALIADAILLKQREDIVSICNTEMFPAEAVLLKDRCDIVSPYTAAILAADAVIVKRWEDNATSHVAAMRPAGAVYASHRTDTASTHEAAAIMAGAVSVEATGRHSVDDTIVLQCGDGLTVSAEMLSQYADEAMVQALDAIFATFRECIGTTPILSAGVSDSAPVSAGEDNQTAGYRDMRVADPLPVAAEGESKSAEETGVYTAGGVFLETDPESHILTEGCEAAVDAAQATTIGSLLHFVTRCEAHVSVASVAGVAAESANKTTVNAWIDFDADEPDVPIVDGWLAPVQDGTNVYIRSAYPQWQEGGKVRLDSGGVFHDPVQEGTNVYIRSQGSMKEVKTNA